MKINPSIASLKADKTTTQAPAERPAANASGTAASPKPDTIHLSALSSQLQAIQANIEPGAPFDRAKVEAIKAAIRDGSLQVNPEAIADKMISDTLALLGQGK